MMTPFFGSALDFAFKQATPEGKTTICVLLILSIFSWTVIISKGRQLWRARKAGKKFFAAYRETRDPMELARRGDEFDGDAVAQLKSIGREPPKGFPHQFVVRFDVESSQPQSIQFSAR